MIATLLAVAIVGRVHSATVQLPVFGSGAFFYEHYSQNSSTPNLVEYLTFPVAIGNPGTGFVHVNVPDLTIQLN